jgi:hypothetical protein
MRVGSRDEETEAALHDVQETKWVIAEGQKSWKFYIIEAK